MKRILFITALLFCSLCLWGQQTIYVIDNVTVDKFDGSQLKGKTIGDYQITTTGKGNKAVTVHAITTVKGRGRKIIINENGQLIMRADSLFSSSGLTGFGFGSGTLPKFVYIIDGKVVEDSEIKNVPTSQIENITVVKDAESLKKYNLSDNSIVVNITTRRKESAK